MPLHIAVKAVADGNETCTAGRLDDCAFMGASAVEFFVACLLRNGSSKMCFFGASSCISSIETEKSLQP